MHVFCTHINWDISDTDGEIPRLPKTMVMEWDNEDDDEWQFDGFGIIA